MKLRNIAISSLFLTILFVMLGWNICQGIAYQQGKIKKNNTMSWKTPDKVYENNEFLNNVERGKTLLGNVVGNFMPFYSEVLVTHENLNYQMNYRLYQAIFGESNWFVPVGKDDYDYKFEKKDHSTLVNVYRASEKTLDPNLGQTEQFFQDLQKSNPNVNLYVYLCNVLDNSSLINDTNLFIKNRQNKVDEFIKSLQPNIQADYLKYNNWDEYEKDFFKTDHHWTIFGAYQGYIDIIQMLSKKAPEIGKPRVPKKFYPVDGVAFRGSIARITAFDKLTDSLWDMDMKLPQYKITIDGQPPFKEFSYKQEYLKGNFDKNEFANHYGQYFHMDVGEIVFDFGKNTGRNLLAFVDSYSNCIDPLLASHYDKAYIIDVRYPPYDSGFNYSQYIQDHNIDDVLFFMYSNSLMYDNEEGNYKQKIVGY